MDLVSTLIDRYFARDGDELRVGQMRISTLAEKFGTPLFVYDRGALTKRWHQLRQALPPEFSIAYSVKANPSRAIFSLRTAATTSGRRCRVQTFVGQSASEAAWILYRGSVNRVASPDPSNKTIPLLPVNPVR